MDNHDDGDLMTVSEWLEIYRSAPLAGKIGLIIITTIFISIPNGLYGMTRLPFLVNDARIFELFFFRPIAWAPIRLYVIQG